LPAYTAPELLDTKNLAVNYATDVYGLGLILYELLVGEPTFPFKLRSDAEVYALVQQNHRVTMNRIEDVKNVADMAIRAVSQEAAARPQNAADLAEQLQQQFGQVPEKKTGRRLKLKTSLIVIATLLAIAFLITLAVTVDELFRLLS
jgi:serine/threonine protein kinase